MRRREAARRGEDVLCGDESPVNVWTNDLDAETNQPVAGAPHAVTLRTPDTRLIWYTAMPSRLQGGDRRSRCPPGLGWLSDPRRLRRLAPVRYAPGRGAAMLCPHHQTLQGAWQSCTRTGRNGLRRSFRYSRTQRRPSSRPAPPAPANSTPSCWPTCANATTKPSNGASPPTGIATGTKATTPATPSPHD